jgi:hypothetical protein
MGIDLYCNNKTVGCSYSSWNRIRKYILIATHRYIIEYLNNIITNEITHECYDKEEYLSECKKHLTMFNTIFNNGNEVSINEFISNVFLSKEVWGDLFIKYDINGIYVLCHKNDCEGYYSPGNALDICKLLELIKNTNEEYFKEKGVYDIIYVNDENPIDECFCSIYHLFEESWKTNKRITIC